MIAAIAAVASNDIEASASPKQMEIREQSYGLSTEFIVDAGGEYIGKFEKTRLAVRNRYDYYDADGELSSQGIVRLFSLGSFYAWSTVMDVYDESGAYMGQINGSLFTTERAKFRLFNAEGSHVANAYLNRDSSAFVICGTKQNNRVLAQFDRVFRRDVVDHWKLNLYDGATEEVPESLLMMFGCFAIDFQECFKEDK